MADARARHYSNGPRGGGTLIARTLITRFQNYLVDLERAGLELSGGREGVQKRGKGIAARRRDEAISLALDTIARRPTYSSGYSCLRSSRADRREAEKGISRIPEYRARLIKENVTRDLYSAPSARDMADLIRSYFVTSLRANGTSEEVPCLRSVISPFKFTIKKIGGNLLHAGRHFRRATHARRTGICRLFFRTADISS